MKDHKDIYKAASRKDVIDFIYRDLDPKAGRDLKLSLFFFFFGILGLFFRYFSNPPASYLDAILYLVTIASLLLSLVNLHQHIFKNEKLIIESNPAADNIVRQIQPSEKAPGHPPETFFRDGELDRWLRSEPKISMEENINYRVAVRDHLRANSKTIERLIRTNFIDAKKNGRQFHNEKKICLAGDITKGMEISKYYIGNYFENFCTNDFFAKLLRTSGSSPQLIATGLNLMPRLGQAINPISTSNMSNQIGISTLAISSDGFIQLWKQGYKNELSPGKVVATGSGSLDDSDLSESADLLRTVRNGMEREFREESSEMGAEFPIDPVIDTRITGYFRWIRRGGKPEFVGVTRLKVSIDDLKPNAGEVEAHEFLNTRIPARCWTELTNSISELLNNDTHFAVSAWVSLICLLEIAKDRPEDWEAFLFN